LIFPRKGNKGGKKIATKVEKSPVGVVRPKIGGEPVEEIRLSFFLLRRFPSFGDVRLSPEALGGRRGGEQTSV